MMIPITRRKKYHWYAIPMVNEEYACMFPANSWIYFKNGKSNHGIPAVVLPSLVHIWGGEEAVREAGYTKHWSVFMNPITGEYTFGNKPLCEVSPDPNDRAEAALMPVVDIQQLQLL